MEKDKFDVNWKAVQEITSFNISKKERNKKIDLNIDRSTKELENAEQRNKTANSVLIPEGIYIGYNLLLACMGCNLLKMSIAYPLIIHIFITGLFVKNKIEAKENIDYYKKEKVYFEQLKTLYADYNDEDKFYEKPKALRLNNNYKGILYGNIEK